MVEDASQRDLDFEDTVLGIAEFSVEGYADIMGEIFGFTFNQENHTGVFPSDAHLNNFMYTIGDEDKISFVDFGAYDSVPFHVALNKMLCNDDIFEFFSALFYMKEDEEIEMEKTENSYRVDSYYNFMSNSNDEISRNNDQKINIHYHHHSNDNDNDNNDSNDDESSKKKPTNKRTSSSSITATTTKDGKSKRSKK